ncbi:MAG: hypothetical protein AB7O97_04680 [Planctomycetota bacterium]
MTRRTGAWLAALAAAPLPAQSPRVEVMLVSPVDAVVARALRERLPDAVVRVASDVDETPAAGPADGAIVVATATRLERLARRRALLPLGDVRREWRPAGGDGAPRWVLPWTLRPALALPADLAAGRAPWTFEELALSIDLHDRIAMCPPSVDPVPWLLAMHEVRVRGLEEQAGYALWTTLDARVGAYRRDYAAVLDAMAAGAAQAAVVPRALVAAPGWPAGWVAVPWRTQAGIPVGLAVLGGADPVTLAAARSALDVLAAAHVEIGAATGLDAPGPSDPQLPPEFVDPWFAHFGGHIEGRGRRVEQVADVLDLVFSGLFAAAVIGVLWWRRREARRIRDGATPGGSP